ncbi:hypothetical protein ND748_12770 [Frankia sp. AiPs1]|uniref:hypothetical protein n=1 Tax=Frankia sp. AiPs1 TaxID=573493 RepID=UPI0020434226|nr:hypothetical protein [Frankia sp. AiPs1]MCM3922528.1 hypothetical protein [Frankia sp. AiPs1]
MSLPARRTKVEKYFRRKIDGTPRKHAIYFSLAAVTVAFLAFTEFGQGGESILVGLALLASAGIMAYIGYRREMTYREERRRPADEEVDRILADDLADLVQEAYRELHITSDDLVLQKDDPSPLAELDRSRPPAREPYIVLGAGNPCRLAVGRDGRLRLDRYQVAIFCPTRFKLGVYECELSLTDGTWQDPSWTGIFYRHVVAIRKSSAKIDEENNAIQKWDDEKDAFIAFEAERVRKFELHTSGGVGIELTIGVGIDGRTEEFLDLGIDRVIKAIQQVLRQQGGEARY